MFYILIVVVVTQLYIWVTIQSTGQFKRVDFISLNHTSVKLACLKNCRVSMQNLLQKESFRKNGRSTVHSGQGD